MPDNTDGKGGDTPFRKWYEYNKEELNARRRQRYATDPDYRNRQLQMARIRREKQRANKAKEVTGLTTTQVAQLIGRRPQTIRTWEKRGLIPAPEMTSAGIRSYKPHHVALLRELAELMPTYFTTERGDFEGRVQELTARIKENW